MYLDRLFLVNKCPNDLKFKNKNKLKSYKQQVTHGMCVDYVFWAKRDFKLNVLGARLRKQTNLEQAHYKFIIIKQLGKSRA